MIDTPNILDRSTFSLLCVSFQFVVCASDRKWLFRSDQDSVQKIQIFISHRNQLLSVFISNNSSRMMGVSIIYWLIFLFPRFSHIKICFVFGNGTTAGHNSLSFKKWLIFWKISNFISKSYSWFLFWFIGLSKLHTTYMLHMYMNIIHINFWIRRSQLQSTFKIDSNWLKLIIDINQNLLCHKNTPFF